MERDLRNHEGNFVAEIIRMDDNFVKVETSLNEVKAAMEKGFTKVNEQVDCQAMELREDWESMEVLFQGLKDWEDRSVEFEETVQ